MAGADGAVSSFSFSDQLITSIHLGIVFQNREGQITWANPASERILGLSFDQMRGVTSLDPRWRAIHADGTPFPGEDHPAMVALRTGDSIHNVLMGVFNPRQSRQTWINVNAYAVKDKADGSVQGVYATFEDITEGKRHEQELKDSADRLQLALDASKLGTWDSDRATGRLVLDRRWCEIIGYAPEEIPPTNGAWLDLVHPEDKAGALEALTAHERGDLPFYKCEYRLRHKTGHWVWVASRGQAIARDKEGKVLRIMGTTKDISSERRLADDGAEFLRRVETLVKDLVARRSEPTVADGAQNRPVPEMLTRRQRQILIMIARGMTSADIGKELKVATATVISHRRRLMNVLQLHSAADVTRFAIKHKLVEE